MYSMNAEARNELQTLFNYDSTIDYTENLNLKMPNFEKFSLSTLCQNSNFSNYCKIVEKLPGLETTMHFMNLAKFPLDFDKSEIKNFIR